MVYIYVIKLEKGKYYIGKTNNPDFRLNAHFNSNAAAWTKTYKPLKLIELIPNCDNYDEDKYTKKYMDLYGINNVRGGSFASIKLNKSVIDSLKRMNYGTNDKCFICGKNGHFAKNCTEQESSESEEEYEEVWCCQYCDKEFLTKKRAIFHENVHCKKNNDPICYRCGRSGHYSSNCYALKHINGYFL